MQRRLQILRAEDCRLIDEAARQLLFDSGVDVHSEEARDLLAEAGAMVDAGSVRVRFSNSVLQDALRLAPKEILLASRDGRHDVRVPGGRPYVTSDGAGVNVWDLDTGERRGSTQSDLADLTPVADALDVVDAVWPMAVAGDVPAEVHGLVEAVTVFEKTSEHVPHEPRSPKEAEG